MHVPQMTRRLIAFDTDGRMIGIRDNLKFMQFTGLRDRTNREIYDGDIVVTSNDGADGCDRWAECDYGFAVVEFTLAYGVKFIQNNYCWSWDDENSVYAIQYLRVVGNKYENPELLNGNRKP